MIIFITIFTLLFCFKNNKVETIFLTMSVTKSFLTNETLCINHFFFYLKCSKCGILVLTSIPHLDIFTKLKNTKTNVIISVSYKTFVK